MSQSSQASVRYMNDSVSSISKMSNAANASLAMSSSADDGMRTSIVTNQNDDRHNYDYECDGDSRKKARKFGGRVLCSCWTELNNKTTDNHTQKFTVCMHCQIAVNHHKKSLAVQMHLNK